MYQQVVPVNQDRHAKTKVKVNNDFHFAAGFHLAYVTAHEFVRAAADPLFEILLQLDLDFVA